VARLGFRGNAGVLVQQAASVFDSLITFFRKIDRFCDLFPSAFATRILVVLQKRLTVASGGDAP